MKYLKMLGLAAVAAMALTAFLGAGSASATVLCKTNLSSSCGSWDYASGTEIHAVLDSGAHASLNGFWTDVTCRSSTLRAKTSTTGGSSSTVSGEIEAISFSECSCSGGAVGSAHANTLTTGFWEVHPISLTTNGTLTGSTTVVTFDCTALGSQCRFGSGTGIDLGTLTGGSPATADVEASVVWSKGTGDEGTFTCGNNIKLEAAYEVTTPNPLYVSEN